MAKKRELETFLESLSHGRVAESGEFKIDPSELLRKFGAVLPSSDGWLVKVLQAVNHWHAHGVEIKVDRRTLTLSARGVSPKHPLTCTTVFKHEKEWRGHYHLFAALLTLINDKSNASCSFQWSFAEAKHELTFKGEELVRASDVWREESERDLNEFRLSITKNVSQKKAFKVFWKADFGNILQLVRDRCKCYPIPIRIDGRNVAFPQGMPVEHTLTKGHGLVLDEWNEPDRRSSGLLGVQVFYDPDGKGVADNVAPGNYLAWIQDGVVADFELESRRKEALNVITFVDGQGLANDLTTLQIRNSKEKSDRLQQISQNLDWRGQVLNSLRWRISNNKPINPGKFTGPVLKTAILPAMLQSASHEKHRSEHNLKVKSYQLFQKVEQEAVWLARQGKHLSFSSEEPR
jgi:hypothetical protein